MSDYTKHLAFPSPPKGEKKWIVSYYLALDKNDSNGKILTMQLKASESFGEKADYTDEEAHKVLKFIQSHKPPECLETRWGMKTFSEWEKFKKDLDEKIINMASTFK